MEWGPELERGGGQFTGRREKQRFGNVMFTLPGKLNNNNNNKNKQKTLVNSLSGIGPPI